MVTGFVRMIGKSEPSVFKAMDTLADEPYDSLDFHRGWRQKASSNPPPRTETSGQGRTDWPLSRIAWLAPKDAEKKRTFKAKAMLGQGPRKFIARRDGR
ncbi:hypothetical protein [Alkalidesulfovibrio alkalitolerans]|uniref:hypothetical protein n=1 Tax=Alkalidesulfovibrio alkalitolerans TaxID=293256 RepID=UPI0012694FD3|nr:hypothetical protein [Alkalidesulfovibrio alkalitolerans]